MRYHRIRLEPVRYPGRKGPTWNPYYRQGVLTHILNRNILANAHHAYPCTGPPRTASGART